jgi:hypothetical protein
MYLPCNRPQELLSVGKALKLVIEIADNPAFLIANFLLITFSSESCNVIT